MKRIIKTNKSTAYYFYFCNCEDTLSRGQELPTFNVEMKRFDSDFDAFRYALDYCSPDISIGFADDQLEEALENQDPGFGDPICYGIFKHGRLIFDMDFQYFSQKRADIEGWD